MNAWSFEVLAFSLLFFRIDGARDSHIDSFVHIFDLQFCVCVVCPSVMDNIMKKQSTSQFPLIFAGVLAGIPATNFLSSTSSYMTHSVVSSASNLTLVRVTVPLRHCCGPIFEVIFVITSNTMHFVGMHE
jgi:ABC-type polysaccharide/polyol phosphate export permease